MGNTPIYSQVPLNQTTPPTTKWRDLTHEQRMIFMPLARALGDKRPMHVINAIGQKLPISGRAAQDAE